MNKRQLANKIWESANQMRSKIEANEYKDYILGFLFYKFLSDKETSTLHENDYDDDDIKTLTLAAENVDDEVFRGAKDFCQKKLGYFVAYDYLFSTWLRSPSFTAGDVTRGLDAFARSIDPEYKPLYDKIFHTLETNLSKLGDSEAARAKAIRQLLELIDEVPTDNKQGYDVLGFVYEYLISNFAANAGKKAGEFYTPHEVSVLMSEIVADWLKDRNEIKIYDPTSGSGSLLVNIGESFAKRIGRRGAITYYAQELKENTYNLTRMNLVMRGIQPANIVARCGDTLAEDWPWFDTLDNRASTYEPLFVDAVVSNPPYSQHWDPEHMEDDVRFNGYGVAPASKADFAFLLHDLYHLNSGGIMTIVLPHGVLFRGGAEGEIRKNLIENNHIDAIIGLPPNIFFGTSIPTIVMVLKKNRANTDTLIVDASKGFVKEGKNNRLQASHIKRIVDVVVERKAVPKFSTLASKEEIQRNDYNLNIPRYVDSSEPTEPQDVYALMLGGVPNAEIDALGDYWRAFPKLRDALFRSDDSPYSTLVVSDVRAAIFDSGDVKRFKEQYENALKSLPTFLDSELIKSLDTLDVSREEALLGVDLFERLSTTPLIDRYAAYQILYDAWSAIASDLETIKTEGKDAARKCDPVMVTKKIKGVEQEVQDGWSGHIFPFELVQREMLTAELEKLFDKKARLEAIQSELAEIIDSLSEEDKDGDYLNEAADAFVPKELQAALNNAFDEATTPEIEALQGYLQLLAEKAKPGDKSCYILERREVDWKAVPKGKNGEIARAGVAARIAELRREIVFLEGSLAAALQKADALLQEEKTLNKEIKELQSDLDERAKDAIEKLTDDRIDALLRAKWIAPLVDALRRLPDAVLVELVGRVEKLADKYRETFVDVERQIREASGELIGMLGDLDGPEFDLKGIDELKSLLEGDGDE